MSRQYVSRVGRVSTAYGELAATLAEERAASASIRPPRWETRGIAWGRRKADAGALPSLVREWRSSVANCDRRFAMYTGADVACRRRRLRVFWEGRSAAI
jgi:hypothetical protein